MQGKINHVLLLMIVVLVTGAVGVGVLLKIGTPEGRGHVLPVKDYMDEPKNFVGLKYNIHVQIKELIYYLPEKGKIMGVAPVDNRDVPLLVFIPIDADFNPEVGQRYHMEVVVDEHGLLKVNTLEKN